jgi:hypothetical protein
MAFRQLVLAVVLGVLAYVFIQVHDLQVLAQHLLGLL